MDASSQPAPPPPTSVLFARGVIARLAIWATLRIAVQESWGGSQSAEKRKWLAGEIVDAFEQQNPPPDDQYIEELLLQVMADEFEASVEDGSAESVAQDIVKIWDEARIGKQDLVLRFEEIESKLRGKQVDARYEVVSDPEEDWSDEEEGDDEEVPELINRRLERLTRNNEPEVDEDGFTVVKKNTKHG
ncbi:hypothetical protein AX16_003343 [Volvariella volvacea WC 439]|nr:hypothetical protein AX16_003343 [Volvariella volvacea WC 439]